MASIESCVILATFEWPLRMLIFFRYSEDFMVTYTAALSATLMLIFLYSFSCLTGSTSRFSIIFNPVAPAGSNSFPYDSLFGAAGGLVYLIETPCIIFIKSFCSSSPGLYHRLLFYLTSPSL